MTSSWRSRSRFGIQRIMAVAVALVCASNFGAADKPAKTEAKFTARTQLVLIPALVTDKSGNHITGLKEEDFTVLENGGERQIATFEEITTSPQQVSKSVNANEFRNFSPANGSMRRITIIVLDLLNTPFTDQAFAREELLKYLSRSLDAREATGLFTLTRTGIHIIHDFTTDPRVLIAALRKIRGDAYQLVDSSENLEAAGGTTNPDGSSAIRSEINGAAVQSEIQKLQEITKLAQEVELNYQSYQQRLATTSTLDAMRQVAQMLEGFPGRKSLIWAGGGFPFSVSDTTMELAPAGRESMSDVLPLYEHTWQILSNAQIALYPVDVKGLQNAVFPAADVRRPDRKYLSDKSWFQLDTQGTFQTFAAATGGRAYFNTNDLAKAFGQAVQDSGQYYMLGYYLDRSDTKPGWRKLTVRVKREHVEIRARSGFFVTNNTLDPNASKEIDIKAALQSPLDYTALPLAGYWGRVEASKEPGKKRVLYILNLAADSSLIDTSDNNR